MSRRFAVVAGAATAICLAFAAHASATVYWANCGTGSVGRVNLDGSIPQPGFIGAGACTGDVAVNGSQIYWTNFLVAGSIARAALDGSGAQTVVGGANKPFGVTLDSQFVYWANNGGGTIGRAGLDGQAPDQSFITGANDPEGVAVNGQHVYWTNYNGDSIGRVELDGITDKQVNFIPGAQGPAAAALSATHVYWANVDDNTIGRATLAGGDVDQDLIPAAFTADPEGVAVAGQFLYWTNASLGTIGRANLDGSNPIRDLYGGASAPFGVEVDGGSFTLPPPALATPAVLPAATGARAAALKACKKKKSKKKRRKCLKRANRLPL